MTAFQPASLEARCDTLLLRRLGGEVARLYSDTLQAPLPPRLRDLLIQLDELSAAADRDDTTES